MVESLSPEYTTIRRCF